MLFQKDEEVTSNLAENRNQTFQSNSDDSLNSEDDQIIIKKDQPHDKQNVVFGLIFATVFAIANGVVLANQKFAIQRFQLEFVQLMVPQSLALIFGALCFGSFNGVKFQEPSDKRRVYSFYSYSWPANPFIHQMIIHRAMMVIFNYCFTMYTLSRLPTDVSVPILLLQPFFIGAVAYLSG